MLKEWKDLLRKDSSADKVIITTGSKRKAVSFYSNDNWVGLVMVVNNRMCQWVKLRSGAGMKMGRWRR